MIEALYTAAHAFAPERLRLGRELRGLTKAELAARAGKTPIAIGQFERGQAGPHPTTLKELALALGLPLGFFAPRNPVAPIDLAQCHFRSVRSASQRQRRKLVAMGSLLVEFAELLDELVEHPYRLNLPVADEPVRDREGIEALADTVREAWGRGGGPIGNMVRLLERNGVLVVRIAGDDRQLDAFSCWHRRRPCVFLSMDKDSASRSRFDAAHELGHLLMHEDVSPGDRQREREANAFAAAFLLPREAMQRELPRRFRWPHFVELKQRWKVSLAALVRRARDLGLLSEASYRRANIELRRHGFPEPAEPPVERPEFLPKAFAAARLDADDTMLAERLGLSHAELRLLVDGAAGAEVQLPLFS